VRQGPRASSAAIGRLGGARVLGGGENPPQGAGRQGVNGQSYALSATVLPQNLSVSTLGEDKRVSPWQHVRSSFPYTGAPLWLPQTLIETRVP
jgi:hypothetical protein